MVDFSVKCFLSRLTPEAVAGNLDVALNFQSQLCPWSNFVYKKTKGTSF